MRIEGREAPTPPAPAPLSRIAILQKALQPLADMYLFPDDFGADMAANIREDVDWDETTNDEANCAEGIRRGHIRAARLALKGVLL